MDGRPSLVPIAIGSICPFFSLHPLYQSGCNLTIQPNTETKDNPSQLELQIQKNRRTTKGPKTSLDAAYLRIAQM
jgi:hypothetical protein